MWKIKKEKRKKKIVEKERHKKKEITANKREKRDCTLVINKFATGMVRGEEIADIIYRGRKMGEGKNITEY